MEGTWNTVKSQDLPSTTAGRNIRVSFKTFTSDSGVKNMIDIRVVVNKRFSKTGVCFYTHEYDWFLQKIPKLKRRVTQTFGVRCFVLRAEDNGIKVDLCTPFKNSSVFLTKEECKNLPKNGEFGNSTTGDDPGSVSKDNKSDD